MSRYIAAGRAASAYEVAVANGFVGTEAEWLASLKGPKGDPGNPDPVLTEFTYDPATGNLLSYKEDGVPILLTYNADGTVATAKRGTGPTRTYSYTGGNLSGVA